MYQSYLAEVYDKSNISYIKTLDFIITTINIETVVTKLNVYLRFEISWYLPVSQTNLVSVSKFSRGKTCNDEDRS